MRLRSLAWRPPSRPLGRSTRWIAVTSPTPAADDTAPDGKERATTATPVFPSDQQPCSRYHSSSGSSRNTLRTPARQSALSAVKYVSPSAKRRRMSTFKLSRW